MPVHSIRIDIPRYRYVIGSARGSPPLPAMRTGILSRPKDGSLVRWGCPASPPWSRTGPQAMTGRPRGVKGKAGARLSLRPEGLHDVGLLEHARHLGMTGAVEAALCPFARRASSKQGERAAYPISEE